MRYIYCYVIITDSFVETYSIVFDGRSIFPFWSNIPQFIQKILSGYPHVIKPKSAVIHTYWLGIRERNEKEAGEIWENKRDIEESVDIQLMGM